uniref:Uncharacterized protein n=1 Tax=Arundo donax TaxID=35708 RepID=A0A0A9GFJ0_ARUDO
MRRNFCYFRTRPFRYHLATSIIIVGWHIRLPACHRVSIS